MRSVPKGQLRVSRSIAPLAGVDRGRDIHVERSQQLIRRPHRLAKQLGEPFVGSAETTARVEASWLLAAEALLLCCSNDVASTSAAALS
jgi:hypothetical protein